MAHKQGMLGGARAGVVTAGDITWRPSKENYVAPKQGILHGNQEGNAQAGDVMWRPSRLVALMFLAFLPFSGGGAGAPCSELRYGGGHVCGGEGALHRPGEGSTLDYFYYWWLFNFRASY